MLKRYLVFSFDQYYPGGGWNDFVGSYDTPTEAQEVNGMTQIVDSVDGKVIFGEDAPGH